MLVVSIQYMLEVEDRRGACERRVFFTNVSVDGIVATISELE